MPPPSLKRLYALRAGYLLLIIGLGITVWPGIIHRDKPWELMHGVVNCMLGAIGLLALLGLRHPMHMLPLLVFEITWKSLWLLVVALPLWRAGQIDADTAATIFACAVAVVFPLVIPWPYFVATYVTSQADPWR